MTAVGAFPVVDHHCHLSPSGEGIDAVRRFRAAGGTHLFLCTQSYGPEPPMDLPGYEEQFATTLRLAEEARDRTGVSVRVVVAPYPVDLVAQLPRLGPERSVELHRLALRSAGRLVREQRAVALGEVGRPHFPVDAAVSSAASEVFRSALEEARDAGCPVVVHCEELEPSAYAALAGEARSAGLDPSRVVKHYARRVLPAGDRHGVTSSYLASRDNVASAAPADGPYFFETDFLDDPRRPGAVLDLATIPRRAAGLAAQGPSALERLRIPFEDSVLKVYGFRPSVEELRDP